MSKSELKLAFRVSVLLPLIGYLMRLNGRLMEARRVDTGED